MFPQDTAILLCDDMPAVRAWEKKQLIKLGYNKILEAENGDKAFEIREHQLDKKDPVKLILCDWYMPILDGLELLKKLHQHSDFKKIPFVMISAESDAPNGLKAMQVGVTNYITRPFARGIKTKITNSL